MTNYGNVTVPTTAAEVTTGWLTTCLRHAGHDVDVLDFHAQSIGNGMMGAAQRLAMTLAGDDENAPKMLVLKYAPDGAASRRTGQPVSLKSVRESCRQLRITAAGTI